jgi:hypothetical protein
MMKRQLTMECESLLAFHAPISDWPTTTAGTYKIFSVPFIANDETPAGRRQQQATKNLWHFVLQWLAIITD